MRERPDEKKWISDEDAERKHGFPRELLAVWSGRDFEAPASAADRQTRRRVVLAHYAELLDLPLGGLAGKKVARRAERDLVAMLTTRPGEAGKMRTHRFQVLSIYVGLLGDDRLGGQELLVLYEDAQRGRPSPREVEEEYRRYRRAPADLSENN